ncbi:hypothetical protein WG66_002661, partial [Moniliophthora roreri]
NVSAIEAKWSGEMMTVQEKPALSLSLSHFALCLHRRGFEPLDCLYWVKNSTSTLGTPILSPYRRSLNHNARVVESKGPDYGFRRAIFTFLSVSCSLPTGIVRLAASPDIPVDHPTTAVRGHERLKASFRRARISCGTPGHHKYHDVQHQSMKTASLEDVPERNFPAQQALDAQYGPF